MFVIYNSNGYSKLQKLESMVKHVYLYKPHKNNHMVSWLELPNYMVTVETYCKGIGKLAGFYFLPPLRSKCFHVYLGVFVY